MPKTLDLSGLGRLAVGSSERLLLLNSPKVTAQTRVHVAARPCPPWGGKVSRWLLSFPSHNEQSLRAYLCHQAELEAELPERGRRHRPGVWWSLGVCPLCANVTPVRLHETLSKDHAEFFTTVQTFSSMQPHSGAAERVEYWYIPIWGETVQPTERHHNVLPE